MPPKEVVNDTPSDHPDPCIPRLLWSKPKNTRMTNGQAFKLHDLGMCETLRILRVYMG